MQRLNVFDKQDLSKQLMGDSFKYRVPGIDLDNQESLLFLLDKVCELEGLISLNGAWNRIEFFQAEDLLLNTVRYDLAFASSERMSLKDAQIIQRSILKDVDQSKCRCFTNWCQVTWQNGPTVWNSISEHTFDIAIAIFTPDGVLFTYILSED